MKHLEISYCQILPIVLQVGIASLRVHLKLADMTVQFIRNLTKACSAIQVPNWKNWIANQSRNQMELKNSENTVLLGFSVAKLIVFFQSAKSVGLIIKSIPICSIVDMDCPSQ